MSKKDILTRLRPNSKEWQVMGIAIDDQWNLYLAGFVKGHHGVQNITMKVNANKQPCWVAPLSSSLLCPVLRIAVDRLGNNYTLSVSNIHLEQGVAHIYKYNSDGWLLWVVEITGLNTFGTDIAMGFGSSGYLFIRTEAFIAKDHATANLVFDVDGHLVRTVMYRPTDAPKTKLDFQMNFLQHTYCRVARSPEHIQRVSNHYAKLYHDDSLHFRAHIQAQVKKMQHATFQ